MQLFKRDLVDAFDQSLQESKEEVVVEEEKDSGGKAWIQEANDCNAEKVQVAHHMIEKGETEEVEDLLLRYDDEDCQFPYDVCIKTSRWLHLSNFCFSC